MATQLPPVNIPKPPDNPNLDELHKWALTLYSFLVTNMGSGAQAPFFSQAQLDEMVSLNDLTQAGKVFMNHDTGKLNAGTVVGGNLVMQVV